MLARRYVRMHETVTPLPFIIIIIPILGSVLIAIFGTKKGVPREGICLISMGLTLIISVYTVFQTFFIRDIKKVLLNQALEQFEVYNIRYLINIYA